MPKMQSCPKMATADTAHPFTLLGVLLHIANLIGRSELGAYRAVAFQEYGQINNQRLERALNQPYHVGCTARAPHIHIHLYVVSPPATNTHITGTPHQQIQTSPSLAGVLYLQDKQRPSKEFTLWNLQDA